MSFTKLHGTIVYSSIWAESSDTRVVWITMLAIADMDGVVQASVSGLARCAVVDEDACRDAIEKFLGPDPDSRDGTTGERIEKVPGGWLLINHEQYRDKQTRAQMLTAARVAKHRAKKKQQAKEDVTSNNVTARNARNELPPSEAEAEADNRSKKKREESLSLPLGLDSPSMREAWKNWIGHRKQLKKPLTPNTVKQLLKKFTEWGAARSIAAIEHTILKGWQGLRESEEHGTPGTRTDIEERNLEASQERLRARQAEDAIATKETQERFARREAGA